jgi:CRP-like cAMP-binding protein
MEERERLFEQLVELGDEIDVEAGTRLVHEGEVAYEVFAIVSGTAEVTHESRLLGELGPGDIFGEVGVLSMGIRTADVTATSAMHVIFVSDWKFKRLVRERPELAAAVRGVIEERSRELVAR